MDIDFLTRYGEDIKANFLGQCISTAQSSRFSKYVAINPGGNSGAGAISWAQRQGADDVILLGYDCQTGPNGETHHHGDHPKGLGNAGSLPKWPRQFKELASRLPDLNIVNASRATALDIWPRVDLDAALKNKEP